MQYASEKTSAVNPYGGLDLVVCALDFLLTLVILNVGQHQLCQQIEGKSMSKWCDVQFKMLFKAQ